jgi:16S rRNA (guanine966-N2)-methyltransferase
VLRIVAGEYGSRRIAAPAGNATRPTSDRVREAIFSMIGPLEGEHVLDLFAGSGAMGIEAISRGADEAVFVDRSETSIRCIRANLELLGIQAEVHRLDWLAALDSFRRKGERFDLVFLDPPYAEASTVFSRIGEELGGLLADSALVICESGDGPAPVNGLRLLRERRHGASLIRLYASF